MGHTAKSMYILECSTVHYCTLYLYLITRSTGNDTTTVTGTVPVLVHPGVSSDVHGHAEFSYFYRRQSDKT